MTCEEMIKEYIIKNGYGGLVNVEGECGCPLDDFMPCGESCLECEAAYKHKDKVIGFLMSRDHNPPSDKELQRIRKSI